MTVKFVLFFSRPGIIFLPDKKKGGMMGTMGPGSVPLANQTQNSTDPGMPGPGPKLSRPKNAGTRPKAQPAQERPGEPSPEYPGASYPRRLLSRRDQVPRYPFTLMPPFPIDNFTKRNCQPAFHDMSKCSSKNQSPRLQWNRKTFPTAARSGKRLHKKKNKSSFPK